MSSSVCFHCGTPCGVYSPTKNYKISYLDGKPQHIYIGAPRGGLEPLSLEPKSLEPTVYDESRQCGYGEVMNIFFGSKWKNYYKLTAKDWDKYCPAIVRRDDVTEQQVEDAFRLTIVDTIRDKNGEVVMNAWGYAN